MKLAIAIFVLTSAVVVLGEQYTTKYDNIDLDEILKNERLTKKYVDCCLEKGPCTKDGEELKGHITDALQTGCSKCSERQKDGVRKVCHHLIKNKPDWWKELCDKYDPKGEHKSKYSEFLKQEGLTF